MLLFDEVLERSLLAIVATATLLLSQSASADAQYDPVALANVDSITLLPILFPADTDADDQAKAIDAAYKELRRQLALKGYVLDKPRNWTPPEEWTYETLLDMPPQDIARLAPPHSEHFTLAYLHALDKSSFVVASGAKASLQIKLIDRRTGELVWQNETTGKHSESWLGEGYFVMLLTRDDLAAIWKGFVELFEDFPEKPY